MAKAPVRTSIPPQWDSYLRSVSGSFARHMFGRDDAYQVARFAYVRACRGYKRARGPFENYAKSAVRKALISASQSEQRHLDGPKLLEEAQEECGDPPALPAWRGEADFLATVEARRRTEAVQQWLHRLPRRLRTVCERIYFDGLSQRDLAAEQGVSQPRINQLHQRLLTLGAKQLKHLK